MESPELRAKVWCRVDREVSAVLSPSPTTNAAPSHTASKKYTTALVEVLLARLRELSTDLEQFAAHDTGRHSSQGSAGPTVTAADLRLWLRHSPELQRRLGLVETASLD